MQSIQALQGEGLSTWVLVGLDSAMTLGVSGPEIGASDLTNESKGGTGG